MDGKKRKGLASGLSSRELRGAEEMKRGGKASLRPIYPKVMALKNGVKSEVDVTALVLGGIQDERIEKKLSPRELSCQSAV